MNTSRFVGTVAVRTITAALIGVCASLSILAGAGSRLLFWAAVLSGLLAWIGLVHSFSPLFRGWMRFAERLQAVAVTILFGTCYLLVVPLFTLFVRARDPLRLGKKTRQDTSWVPRTQSIDLQSMERMG